MFISGMDVEIIMESIQKHDLKVLYTISATYILTAALVFCILFYGITAPYGRYVRGGWGLNVNGKVAWFVQEIPSFVVPLLFVLTDAPGLKKTPNLFFVALFLCHYFQSGGSGGIMRTAFYWSCLNNPQVPNGPRLRMSLLGEGSDVTSCIFPFLIKGGKPTPFIPFILALMFCTVNGYLQTSYLLYHAAFPARWWLTPHVLTGVSMFVCGLMVNIHSDHILRNLRKPGETGYKIPQGGMFNYVSGANFFGEMLEWAGFAVATWSLPALSFAVFTWCNIGPRAYQHHKYYLQKFEDYPKDRKAVIPFIL